MVILLLVIVAAIIFVTGGDLLINPKVKMMAQAIAHAEGFGVSSTNLPTRNHNPGDLEIGDIGYGVDHLKTIFPDDATGWKYLYKQVELIMNEQSKAGYTLDDTIYDFARRYSGNDNTSSYAAALSNYLNVSTDTTLGEYFNV